MKAPQTGDVIALYYLELAKISNTHGRKMEESRLVIRNN